MARPNRGEHFSNDSARAIFAAFKVLPKGLQWEFYRAALQLLAIPEGHQQTHRSRQARAIGALQEAFELNDQRSPSVERYRTLRLAHSELEWPEDRSLRRWLGANSWNDALAQARLPVVPDGDVLILQLGPAFTREEGRVALQQCALDCGYPPSWSEYLSWAKRPDVKSRQGRRPLSQGPFARLYGPNWWNQARIDAGIVDGPGAPAGADGRIRSATYFADYEQIGKDLRKVADRLGRSPRVVEYTAERHSIYVETLAAGRACALVGYATIQKRYGTWDAALVAHGLAPLGGRHTGAKTGPKGPTGKRITDDTICAAIREGFEALGTPFTQPAYSQWRKNEIERSPRRARELPSYYTIWGRFGTWEGACDIAFGEDDNEGEPPGGASVAA